MLTQQDLIHKQNVQLELTNLRQVNQVVLMQMQVTMLIQQDLIHKLNVQLELTNLLQVNQIA